MQRSALRNLTVGLVAAVTLSATASFAVADDDLGLAAGEHTISIPGVGDVMLTVDADGHLEVFTAPEGFALVEGSLEGGDELEFSLAATTDAGVDLEIEFAIEDGQLSVFGDVSEAGDVDVDDESVDSEDSLDSEPSSDASDDSVDSEPSEDSEPSVDSEDSLDSEPSEESLDSEPSADDSEPSADDSVESEDSAV